ncbi:GAF domain-containing sensor histidine kinase [Roseisolibacter agri]|uniref:GAF domain-containing sensor histidine kinase n=1 Tax=Roseisolibacter agri TaxID=2014610 RepID=UPI0024E179B5|nr:GAF domain-containing sensor histidine kinase [Roseisolibacter agri]
MNRPSSEGSSDPATLWARQQAAVADLGVRALGGLPVPALLQQAARVVAELLDTEFVKVVELLPDGLTARVVAGEGWHDGVVGHATISVGRDSQAGYALLSHAPVIVDDLRTETRLEDPPLLREHGVVSGVSVILYGPERSAYGVLGAHTARRRRFTTDDVSFLQGVANVLSAALHRQHVEDDLRRARTEAEVYAAQLQEQAFELEQQIEEAQALAEELEQTNDELHRAMAEVEAARAAAEAANRAKSDFLATMSHELRTPLNAIQGYTELLALGLRGPVTEAQQQDLERVRLANQHLMSLVTDVLNFARLEAGQVEFHLDAIEIAPLVGELESLIGPQLTAKGLTFSHDACAPDTPESPHVVRADAEKLRQILLNLLTNAIKFTDAGGHVALECATDAVRGVVRLQVADTGRGIPADQLERIFEPFVQVDRHRTRASQQGVGLGLAISRDLARAMGGDLTVESAVGVGSTFTLVLQHAGKEDPTATGAR